MPQYRCAGYWKARKETAQECAERLERFLQSLSRIDGVFTKWFEKGTTRKKAKQIEVIVTKNSLLDLIQRGSRRRDSDNSVMEELGFRIGIWNGETSDKAASLSVTCGLYDTTPGLGGNSVIIDLPEDLGELRLCERMQKVLTLVAQSWEPDWAGVFSLEATDAREFNTSTPFMDWMLYVNNGMVRNSNISECSSAKPVDDIGLLIMSQQEPTDPENPDHLLAIKSIARTLGIN